MLAIPTMLMLAFFAMSGAAVDAGDCSEIPKLCTDLVLLRGVQTTLTYLCPESPSATVTLTSTTTKTVSGSAVPVSTSNGSSPTSEESAVTTTIHSTVQVTVTETVVKTTASPLFSLTPPVITASFPAIPLSEMEPPISAKPTWSAFKNISSTISSMSDISDIPDIDLTSLNLFPTHSATNSSSAAYCVPTYANGSASHSSYSYTPLNAMRQAEPTESVNATAAVVTKPGTGMAGESRISLVVLFLGVIATAVLV